MTIHTVTNDGHHYLSTNGHTIRVDALPPDDHVPAAPAVTGTALVPCTSCGKALGAVLAVPGHHLLCRPVPLTICGLVFSPNLPTVAAGDTFGHWRRFTETTAAPHQDAA
ncbi:MAG: hypothetical protein ACRDT4_05205 [Micromonosporaceae bacterium]